MVLGGAVKYFSQIIRLNTLHLVDVIRGAQKLT